MPDQDQANNTGGCGPCGGEFCPDGTCSTCRRESRWDDFHPVFFGNVGPLPDDSDEMQSKPEDKEPRDDEAER
jgi:hypothetical protein